MNVAEPEVAVAFGHLLAASGMGVDLGHTVEHIDHVIG
jgi:hypothetical protein